jgi:hypothetical protein
MGRLALHAGEAHGSEDFGASVLTCGRLTAGRKAEGRELTCVRIGDDSLGTMARCCIRGREGVLVGVRPPESHGLAVAPSRSVSQAGRGCTPEERRRGRSHAGA